MAEKLTRKEKIAQQKSVGNSSKEIAKAESGKRALTRVLGLIVALVGIFFYVSTINHDFVLDDFGLIKENNQTKLGISAIPEIFKSPYRYGMNIPDYQLYRPLTKVMFALEWSLAPDTPALGHTINILLYGLLCFILFRVLNLYMKGALLVPFIATLLFAAHPLHVEVVANIKGRDELMTLLLCLLSTLAFYSYVTKKSNRGYILGLLCYFIALFSKESAVTFIAVVPMLYYFFTKAESKNYVMTAVGMIACTAIFLLIRKNVLGNVESLIPVEDNCIAGIKDFFLQKANAIAILGVYLKLMVFPDNLIADGSYNHFPVIGMTSWKFLLPAAILTAALIYAIMNFRKKDVISFGILFFFVTVSLVSNVIILIGTNYGERLMFMPSLGFCIVVAVILSKILKSPSGTAFTNVNSFFAVNVKPILVVAVIVVLFGIRANARNANWANDFALYSHDVKKVPDSAHMLFYYANHISGEDYQAALPDDSARNKVRREAIEYLTRSIEIYPKYADGMQRRGFIYYQLGNYEFAERDYKTSLIYNPTHPIVYNNYGTLCFNQRRYEEALNYFQLAVKYNPTYAHALNNVASVYGVFGQGETEAISKDPANKQLHEQRAKQSFETAITYFQKAIASDKDFLEPYRLLAVTYRNLGNSADADRYEKMHQQVAAKKNVKN